MQADTAAQSSGIIFKYSVSGLFGTVIVYNVLSLKMHQYLGAKICPLYK